MATSTIIDQTAMRLKLKDEQAYISYISALRYLDILLQHYRPTSVIDVGCARGAWLKACRQKGIEKLVGLDGSWTSKTDLIDKSIAFYCMDFNQPIAVPENNRFDIALTLEVAEHLNPASSEIFIASLCSLSDAVIFGAAYTGQGGPGHINEQPHTYWADLFSDHGYLPYDLFRSLVWGDSEIPFWYQQNIFLYVKQHTAASHIVSESGCQPIDNAWFMNCIHPDVLERMQAKN